MPREPPGRFDVYGPKGPATALDIETDGVHHTEGAGDRIRDRRVLADVGADQVERRLPVGKDGTGALRIPDRDPHRELALEKVADDAPAEKTGAAEDHHRAGHRA